MFFACLLFELCVHIRMAIHNVGRVEVIQCFRRCVCLSFFCGFSTKTENKSLQNKYFIKVDSSISHMFLFVRHYVIGVRVHIWNVIELTFDTKLAAFLSACQDIVCIGTDLEILHLVQIQGIRVCMFAFDFTINKYFTYITFAYLNAILLLIK